MASGAESGVRAVESGDGETVSVENAWPDFWEISKDFA